MYKNLKLTNKIWKCKNAKQFIITLRQQVLLDNNMYKTVYNLIVNKSMR